MCARRILCESRLMQLSTAGVQLTALSCQVSQVACQRASDKTAGHRVKTAENTVYLRRTAAHPAFLLALRSLHTVVQRTDLILHSVA